MNRFRRWKLARRISISPGPGKMSIITIKGKIAPEDWEDIQIVIHEIEKKLRV